MGDEEPVMNEVEEPGEVPDPPRPYTPKAKARASREPAVRGCWIVAILIGLSFVYGTYTGLKDWWDEARMINSGPQVQAIGYAEGAKISGRPLPIGSNITVTYTYEGKQYTEAGMLLATGKRYMAGEPFEIRIDPRNPSRWTNRDTPVGIRENLVASIMLAIFALMALGTGLILRAIYLHLWREGELVTARVLEHRHSAMAPHSVGLYCALRAGRNDKPVMVYVPQDGHVPDAGGTIKLIANESCTRAIALSSYHA